jgi:hypothetical protein
MIFKVVNTVTPNPSYNPRLFGTAGFYGSTVLEPLPGWLFHLDVNAVQYMQSYNATECFLVQGLGTKVHPWEDDF